MSAQLLVERGRGLDVSTAVCGEGEGIRCLHSSLWRGGGD